MLHNLSKIKVSKKKGIKYTPSNIIFNDDYFGNIRKVDTETKTEVQYDEDTEKFYEEWSYEDFNE